MTINKDSFEPLYHQLATEIEKKIARGTLKPGDSVPSETKLIDKYDISRGTVRQAMEKLKNAGLIIKFPGRGTFVAEPHKKNQDKDIQEESTTTAKPVIKQGNIQSLFTQIIKSTSKKASITLLDSGIKPVDKTVQNLLKISENEEIYLVDKLLSFDEEPWCLEKSYYRQNISQYFDEIDFTRPLYEQFEKLTNQKLLLTKYITEAITANETYSELLKVEPTAPLFHIIRLSYLDNNVPFELTFATYRGDRIRFNSAVTYTAEDMKVNAKAHKEFR